MNQEDKDLLHQYCQLDMTEFGWACDDILNLMRSSQISDCLLAVLEKEAMENLELYKKNCRIQDREVTHTYTITELIEKSD